MLKRIMSLFTIPEERVADTIIVSERIEEIHQPETMYERIAQGNALADIEATARGKWH